MEYFALNEQNPAFIIRGSEERISVEILKVILKENSTEEVLQLNITDENGFLLYSKPLVPKTPEPFAVQFNEYPEVPVNKRFIFSRQLEVSISAPNGIRFLVEIQYV